jgi:hypothetical protein
MARVFSALLTTRIGRLMLAIAILVTLCFWGCRLVRDERMVDGEMVERRVIWYGRSIANPIRMARLIASYDSEALCVNPRFPRLAGVYT